MFFLSKLKWPDFSKKDDGKSKDQDDKNSCCGCEEIDANNSKMENGINESLESIQRSQGTADANMGGNLLGIENNLKMKKNKISSEPANPELKNLDSRLDGDTKRFDQMVNKYQNDCSCSKLVEDGINLKNFLSMVCNCLLYTSPSPRDLSTSRMPSSA